MAMSPDVKESSGRKGIVMPLARFVKWTKCSMDVYHATATVTVHMLDTEELVTLERTPTGHKVRIGPGRVPQEEMAEDAGGEP